MFIESLDISILHLSWFAFKKMWSVLIPMVAVTIVMTPVLMQCVSNVNLDNAKYVKFAVISSNFDFMISF